MSVFARLRLLPLNPAEGTAKGWLKVFAAYVIVGPLVGAVVAAVVLAVSGAIADAANLRSSSQALGSPVMFLSFFMQTVLLAVTVTYFLSARLAAVTALAILLLSLWMKQRTTMLVLLVPVLVVALSYALKRAFDYNLIGASVTGLLDDPGLAALILSAAVAASLVSWRIATGPAREAAQ